MAFFSNFHHSNHPNFKQPYSTGGRPQRSSRGGSGGDGGYGGGMGGEGGYGGGQGGGEAYGNYQGGGGGQRSGGYQNGGGGGGGNQGNTLWMGNIDENMDEQFIQAAFNAVGVNVANIKIIRNRDSGLPVGYGFITFDDRNTTQNVLRELNGKKIPNVEDDKRFFLKTANRQAGGGGGAPGGGNGGRLAIFVGNLTPDIDDDILYQAFNGLYPSVASAKVIMQEGQSKGFGFVNFEDEYDYQMALNSPNMMLGQVPISIARARHNQNKNGGGGGQRSNGGGGSYQGGNQGGGGGSENGSVRSRRQY